ncbi:uncharacterized protein BDR25DRAFT_30093 [Lindgomyces ingoldianus]|uniref:Uncharacterized protein n=1 Tax=Lindgomyces ingoldianus TaxID=673940 RepID=A0ACB6QVM1_9PLEO|nr:uncharacterized protein BDR25DRAFT_30093 [Lindgomyces ingoldianus]KAF2471069.1 hypothetical protein BDR25DRAFT_30093 [Lindgomyces ingoldianus]
MQSQQMAAMAGMNAAMGPVDGTPVMSSMQRPGGRPDDPRTNLNTYIYDYFMRNNYGRLAKAMLECDLKMNLAPHTKPSPSGRNMNGMDSMDPDVKDDLPQPKIPDGQSADNSFLLDWWCQFWDIYRAARDKNGSKAQHQYIGHTRQLAHIQNQQRDQRMQMNGYQNMMRAGIPNGVPVNDLKRAAAMNNRNPSNPNQMANMNQMKSQMMSAQMQRDGSGMDMNGQRPQSPGSTENAPSPNKRPRVEGNNFNGQQMGVARSQGMQQQPMGATSAAQANQMLLAGGMNSGFNEFAPQAQNVQQKSIEVYTHSLVQQQRIALNNRAMAQGMNSGVQGSPMTQPGLDGQQEIFAGNMVRPGMPAGAPGQPGQGNHALQDYQMQLMLLEQQNKKRLLMARQEQDNMSAGPHGQPPVGAPGFPPSMSPQGSRAGPSPNPNDQIKRGTPKMNQPGLPGSPMGDASMQQNRNSPAPNMNFEQMPPGMPPQFYNPQMPQNPMMRPPSSHPGGNFNGQQLTQQMEQMRHNGAMQNGAWRGPPQGMMQNQGQQLGPMNTPQQQRNPMPPPPAPPAGEQPRAQEPSPSQPAQAPPTPSQTNKANPKKKPTKDNKKPAKSKAANTGATPAASGEEPPPTPTPSTPITPMHPKSFTGQNGQPPAQPQAQPPPAAPAPQQQQPVEPFGNISGEPDDFGILNGFDGSDALENFDFDSFLHVGDDNGAFSSLGGDFGFGDGVEAGGEL